MFNQPNWAATTTSEPQYNTMSRATNTAVRTSPVVAGLTSVTTARTNPVVHQPQSSLVSTNAVSAHPAPPKRQLPQRNTTAFPYSVAAKVAAPKGPAVAPVTLVNHVPPPQVKGPPRAINPPPQVTPVNATPTNLTNQPPPSYPPQLSAPHVKVPPQQAKSPTGHLTGPAPRTGPPQQPAYHIVHNYSTNQNPAPLSHQPWPKHQPSAPVHPPRPQTNQPGLKQPPGPGTNQPGLNQSGLKQPPGPGTVPRPPNTEHQSVQPKSGPRPAPVNLSRSAPNVAPVNRPPPPPAQTPQVPNVLHRSVPVKPNDETSGLDQDTVWALNTLRPFDPNELSINQPTPTTAQKSGDGVPGASSAEVTEPAPVSGPQQSLLPEVDSSFDIELAKFADLLDNQGAIMNNTSVNKSVITGVPATSAQSVQTKQDVLELQQQNQRLSAEIDSLKHNSTLAEQDRRLATNELSAVKKKLKNVSLNVQVHELTCGAARGGVCSTERSSEAEGQGN